MENTILPEPLFIKQLRKKDAFECLVPSPPRCGTAKLVRLKSDRLSNAGSVSPAMGLGQVEARVQRRYRFKK